MKKEMSAFDVRAMVEEMQELVGSHVDKVFHWGEGNVLVRFNVQGAGKRELFFKRRKFLHLAQKKPETPKMPSNFASFVRKHISNSRVNAVEQIGFDRIIRVELSNKEAPIYLVYEIFGGGNVLLVSEGRIMNCVVQKSWRHRQVRPGAEHQMPGQRFDPVTASAEEFIDAVKDSDSDLVRTLATAANLGGQYAEEVCVRSGIYKNSMLSSLAEPELREVHAVMTAMIEELLNSRSPSIYSDGEHYVDVSPLVLKSNSHLQREDRDSFSAAMDEFLSQLQEEEDEAIVDPMLEKLDRRIENQRETIHNYQEEAEACRLKADSIYTDYQRADELLQVLQEQSQKLGWEKLREGAMKIPFVRSIEPSKSTVVADLNGMDVPLDYRESLDANASLLYDKGKEIGERAKRAEAALKETEEQKAKRLKGLMKKQAERSDAKPTRQFWFDRYKWFVSSNGHLVLSGRDARNNDQLVKKHLKDNDIYVHADVHGAPSIVVKEGADASEDDLREAATFALAQSKAWTSCFAEGAAYWVRPDQVSKTPQPGEFVPRGAFIVRGRRNYLYHLLVELAVGEVEYEGARKVMCGPAPVVKKRAQRLVVLRPSKEKKGKQVSKLAKEFHVPEEELARTLPPGSFDIVERKGFKEE